jgi:hypothetical protein
MRSLSETQFWFVVKVAVALTPMLTFWIADGIGWFLRRVPGGARRLRLNPDVSQCGKARPPG